METAEWFERTGSHKYRHHVICNHDDEEIQKEMLADGLKPINDGSNEFIGLEMEINHCQLEFGMALANELSIMAKDKFFLREYLLKFLSESQLAEAGYALSKEPKNLMVITLIKLFGIDKFGIDNLLYLAANNYSKELVNEAIEKYEELDSDAFARWLQENVDRRPGISKELVASYFVCDNLSWPVSSIDVYNAFVDSVWPHAQEFDDWVAHFEHNICDTEFYHSILSGNEVLSGFVIFALFGMGKILPHLFSILNKDGVDLETKNIVFDGLLRVCGLEPDFAEAMQYEYNSYRSLNGGREIIFTSSSSYDVKEPVEEFVLSGSYFSMLKEGSSDEYYTDLSVNFPTDIERQGEVLTSLINRLAKNGDIENSLSTKQLLAYRLTGRGRPTGGLASIAWLGGRNELLYFIKYLVYGNSKWKQTPKFFTLSRKEEFPKNNYSAYAENVTPRFKQLLKEDCDNIFK